MGRTNKMRISVISIILGILLIAFIGVATIVTNNQSQIAFAEPHDHSGWTAWTTTTSLPTSGSYYLTADVSISDTWVVPTGTVNLCLCGHGIRMTGNNSVVTINAGATLKLYDCDTTTEHKYSLSYAKSNGAGFATVNDGLTSGYQTFKGGYITGGTGTAVSSWNRGGALYIEGAVEMYGGTLIGNGQYGTTHGGAFNTQGTGSFKMYGGSIQNNAAQCGGATRLQGSGSCEIYGGKIINNIVTNDGGAIHVGGSISVILQDCEISGNYAGNGPGAGIWMTTTGMVISGRTIITDNLTNSGESNVEIDNGYVIGVGELTDGATIGIKPQSGTGIFTSGWSTNMNGKDPADYFVSDGGYDLVVINNEAYVHQHTYGDLVAKVDVTCDEDGMAAHYHCAECGKYFDENKDETAYDDLIIHTRGHAYQYHAKVEATCTEYGKREHYTCARCGLYFNTNKQVIQSYTISLGTSGHKYDTDSIEFHLTPDESSYYKWKATVSYACINCGEVFEKNASMTSQSATWKVDSCIKAYVEFYNNQLSSEPTQLEFSVSSSYTTIYSEPKFRESDAGTAIINKWTAWEYDDHLPNTLQPSGSEGWYLTKDVTLTDTWTVPVTGLKLCLNGHAIVGNFSTPKTVIYVPKDVKIELYEYNFDETHYYYVGKTVTDSHNNELNFVGQIVDSEEDPNYIAAVRKGSFKGGYITGGTGRVVGGNTYGGAVYIDGDTSTPYYNCGQVEMRGATLFGNYADFGGAVYVATRAYFDFSSGNVIGNQAGSEGGGIYANERAGYNSSNRDGNAGARSYGGNILYNTAGQSGNGYGGGVAGWVELDYCTVQGNAAIGANAKGGAVYGFLYLETRPIITENYTTGFGPGVYVTNYNMRVGSSATFKVYGNRYASDVTVEAIETKGHGDLYFGSGYTFTIYSSYPPGTDGQGGYKAYVEMQSGTGNFTTQWIDGNQEYRRYFGVFAALPGYKITLSGNTLSLQTSSGDYSVDTSKQIVIYTNYYYLNGSTTSATTFTTDENHRYVFSGTRTLTTNIALYGNCADGNDIYLRFNNLDLTAPSNSGYIFYAYPYYGPLNIHIELVGNSVLRSSGIYTAFYGGSYQYPLNIYFTGSGTITFVDTAENGTGNAFGKYSGREAHVQLGGEDISVYEIVKEKIAEIGLEVTFTREIKERIDVARAAYDALDDSLKGKITNYSVLVAAELAYKIAAVQGAIDMIEAIPDVYTIESNASIFLAREAYDALDNEELKGLLETEDPQALVYNRQKLFDAEALMILPMDVTVEGCEVDYDGEAHGIIVTPEVEGATIKYGTQEGEYTLDECPTYTDAGTYTIYYEVTKTKHTTVIGSAVVIISPIDVTVTITGNNSIVDYDGEEHTASGYVAATDSTLYDVASDFTFTGTAEKTRKNAGTTYMELTPDMFTNTNGNFDTVTFEIVDGYVTINKINVTVTITGNTVVVDYDGEEHTVSGYIPMTESTLYDVASDFTFDEEKATAARTNAGTTYMGLTPDMFTNTNGNFDTVTFNVTDGYVTINQINATVTITGNTVVVDYDGEEHTVSGYVPTTESTLYNVASDFTFDEEKATAARTNAGTTYMGLTSDMFTNDNDNFVVTFEIVDGHITINTVDAVVTTIPQTLEPVFDGEEKVLISEAEAIGGTLQYALGGYESAPEDGFAEELPVATEVGTYYVWYKVIADGNHNDLAPVCAKVTLAEPAWVTLNGVIQANNNPVESADVVLMKGNQKVDFVTTAADGAYRFIVPTGVYNVVVKYDNSTETTIVMLFKDEEKNIVLSDGKTESKLEVVTEEDEEIGIAVGGLDEEARAIREAEQIDDSKDVSVVMIVEPKEEEDAAKADEILEQAEDKSLKFFEIKVEKTVDQEKTTLDETSHVLEIVIPYAKTNKRGLIVYSYHGNAVRTFVESETKEDGTFRVDKENGLIYVYANKFSTYAIGYTPYYSVKTSLTLGSYQGTATVTLQNRSDEKIAFTKENVDTSAIEFEDVPKGQYTMTITWTDGKTNTITMPLTVGPKAVEKKAEPEEEGAEEAPEPSNAADVVVAEEEESVVVVTIEEEETVTITDSGFDVSVPVDVAFTNEEQETGEDVRSLPRKRDDDK